MVGRRWVRVALALVAAGAASLPAPTLGSEAVDSAAAGCARFGPPDPDAVPPLHSNRGFLSPDGRFVVFTSFHALVADDTNGVGDVFRYDQVTGEIVRLDLENTGGELRHGALSTGLSDDADRVLFWTGSPDLAGERSEGQVYVRKVTAGRTELVSANVDGRPTNGRVDERADISADGRWVTFSSQGTDIVSTDPRPRDRFAGASDVYLRDLHSNTTQAVTAPFGAFAAGTQSFTAAVSGDGRFVAFTSGAPWTADDSSPSADAFVWDRQTGRYELVSVDPSGRAIGGTAYGMSEDGNLVVFGAADIDGEGGAVYIRDRAARTTRRLHDLNRTSDPSVSLSGDGRVVAIQTLNPIHAGDANGRDDIVLVDTRTGAVRPVVSADPACSPAAGAFRPQLSFDGSLLVVESGWNHIGPRDPREIFTFDTSAGTWAQITPAVIRAGSPGAPTSPPGGNAPPPGPPWGFLPGPVPASGGDPAPTGPPPVSGYWMLTAGGEVHGFGDVPHHGHGEIGAIDIEPTPTRGGYWVLHVDGLVTTHGAAPWLGDAALTADELATTLSATPSGHGYWVFTSQGRVLPFGDAPFFGDMSDATLNGPVLDSVVTGSGLGYFMVASDGGIFAFGDARFAGSMGGHRLNRPVTSMAPDPDGRGYWLVSSDGGIFAFDAPFFGSLGSIRLNEPVTGMVPAARGYLMVAADGGIFAFGDVPFHGSLGSSPPAEPVVAVALNRG